VAAAHQAVVVAAVAVAAGNPLNRALAANSLKFYEQKPGSFESGFWFAGIFLVV
jgi:hypothetical protein